MFHEMRRGKQRLDPQEAAEILVCGTSGVLALAGDDGYPYAVPMSYVYQDGKIWFHAAPSGHKLDAIRRSDKASFCVIDRDEILPEKLTTCYRSVIAFGRIRVLEDGAEYHRAIQILGEKYAPGMTGLIRGEIDKAQGRFVMLQLDVEHMTGKEGIELTNARTQE